MASAHVPSLPALCPIFSALTWGPAPTGQQGQRLYSALCVSQDDALPLFSTPFPSTFFFSFSFCTNITNTPTQTPSSSNAHLVHSCPRHGGKSPPHPVLYGGFLEGDPILFPLPWCLAGWLAPLQHGVRWRGLSLGQCAQKLMNCRRDAGRQPARSSSERPSRTITVCSCDGGNRRDSADNLI